MISIIHPSRGRPEKSFNNMVKWVNSMSSTENVEVLISIDRDDPLCDEYWRRYKVFVDITDVLPTPIDWYHESSVDAINDAASCSHNNIIIVVSDDTESTQDWDVAIIKETQGKTDWILKTQDGIQNWIITMPIMDRAYYNRFGYIYYPGYQHLFCDTELTCVADITGRKITSNLLFHHNHYSIGKSVMDSVYSKNDKTNEQGEKLFLERYARNFDLPKGNPIQGQDMINWLKKRHVNA